MKGRLILTIFLLIALIPLNVEANVSPITVTDFRAKVLNFKKPVNRIVCLIESALSGLYMLHQQDKIVAIPKVVYDGEVFRYYAQLDDRISQKSLPAPGNWDFVSIESVVALKPDLVIIWSSQKEAIATLEQRGIPVYGVFLSSIDDVYKEILDFGKLTGSLQRARALIDYVKGDISSIQRLIKPIPEDKKKSIYFMWAQGILETSCVGSTVDDVITLAGARNVCSMIKQEHIVINLETLLRWNPDVIVMWVNDKKSPTDIIKDSQLRLIKAIKTRDVYELPEIFPCDLWTLKFVYAVKLIAYWSYSEYFKGMNLEVEKTKLLKRLYGKDIK